MNFNAEVAELGVQDTSVPWHWDGNNHKYKRIDDKELAHDMALAEDPLQERAIEQRRFIESLGEDSEATYRRAGSKGILFSELIEEQKSIDEQDSRFTSRYGAVSTTEEYTRRKVADYEGDVWLPKNAVRITNGFVSWLAEQSLKRTMQAANKAGDIVYYKQIQGENIAVYEQHLSERDQEVFRPVDVEPTVSDKREEEQWLGGDREAIALRRRSRQLWQTYKRKRVVEAIAETFGRTTTRGFTRENFERLGEVLKRNSHIIED